MIRVGIVGLNSLSNKLAKILNKDNCFLVCFFTNNSLYFNKKILNKEIIDINKIDNIELDLVINTTNIQIDKRNVLDFTWFIKYFYNFQIYKVFNRIDTANIIEGCVTGLSHFEVGIDESKLNYRIMNLAITSQDLYYDYEMIKYLINNKNHKDIKFCIIGLTYYSFEYDMSKTKNRYRQYPYYSFLNKIRTDYNKEISNFNNFYNLSQNIFIEDFKLEIYKVLKNIHEKRWNEFISGNIDENKLRLGEEFVKKDSKKNYPSTVKENLSILKEYIRFLKENNIMPIIVIPPHTKHYYNNISIDLKKRFEENILQFRNEEEIEIFNFFYCDKFTDEDFYDVAHLNRKGAEKFSLMLNYILINLNN